MEQTKIYPTEPAEITNYLCELWRREYPEQNPFFPRAYHWEYRAMHISFFEKAKPKDMEKAYQYLQDLLSGVIFPPLVYLEVFGEVIDGTHRLWAYQQVGILPAPVYIGKLK